jgi:hypothetical protein
MPTSSTGSLEVEIKTAVAGEELKHVIEEADTR